MNKKNIFLGVMVVFFVGFIAGVTEIITADTWVFDNNYITPNTTITDNILVNGTANFTNKLYYKNSEVCTQNNGLCSVAPGGNQFDQELNISSNVTFQDILVNYTNADGYYEVLTEDGGLWIKGYEDSTKTNATSEFTLDNDGIGYPILVMQSYAYLDGGSFFNVEPESFSYITDGTIEFTSSSFTYNGSEVCTIENGLCVTNPFNQTLDTTSNVSFYELYENNSRVYTKDSLKNDDFTNMTIGNTSIAGTTLVSITNLTWTAKALNNYTFNCYFYFSSNNTQNGLSIALKNNSGTLTDIIYGGTITGVSATTSNSGTARAPSTKITSTAVTAAGTVYPATLSGTVWGGSTDVTLIPQASAEIANSTSTIVRGSSCTIKRIT